MYDKLLISEPPLQVLPSLAVEIGLYEAIFVQQLHYLTRQNRHIRDGRSWYFNTYQGWTDVFPFWKIGTIRRVVRSVREQGVVITTSDYNKMPMDNTLWYAVEYKHPRLHKRADHLPNLGRPSAEFGQSTCAEFDHTNNTEIPKDLKPIQNNGSAAAASISTGSKKGLLGDEDFIAFWDTWDAALPSKIHKREASTVMKENYKLWKRLVKDDPDFMEQYAAAVQAASDSPYLTAASWFKMAFFLGKRREHGYGWRRCLAREFAWKDKEYQATAARTAAVIDARAESRVGGDL